jgi:hypothetical protein
LAAANGNGAIVYTVEEWSATTSVESGTSPDVIVGELHDLRYWGTIGDVSAFSVGTTSCNVGNEPLEWIASTNRHPVIGQNMFRVKDGVFEQIGQSWLKHGFTALQGTVCGACNRYPNGTHLGVGCSDPYSAGLNGSHSNNRLGPKFQINASTGFYPYPPFQAPITNLLSRRIQVDTADLDPNLNQGAVYFVEGQYVTGDDAEAMNHYNNSSYRRVNVSPSSIGFVGGHGTQRELAAIYAWQEVEPSVDIQQVDVPNEAGRFLVGSNVIDLGGGQYRYVYVVQNLNSDRSGASLTLQIPAGVDVSNIGFHDVHYHSGEPIDGTDWEIDRSGNTLSWTLGETFGENEWANAVRWGTAYTFWYDADAGPRDSNASMGLFKPGTPNEINLVLPAPDNCYADCDGSGTLDILDFLCFQDAFVLMDPYADCDQTTGAGVFDVFDFLCFQDFFTTGCP